jgi:thioredoxin 1
LLVACLCAAWCGVCGEYRGRFEQVHATIKADYPQAQFVWLDVEDDDDLLHPLDVDDFPTLLIAKGNVALFFGTLTPQAQTLERMVRNAAQQAMTPVRDLDVHAAVGRIRASKLPA